MKCILTGAAPGQSFTMTCEVFAEEGLPSTQQPGRKSRPALQVWHKSRGRQPHKPEARNPPVALHARYGELRRQISPVSQGSFAADPPPGWATVQQCRLQKEVCVQQCSSPRKCSQPQALLTQVACPLSKPNRREAASPAAWPGRQPAKPKTRTPCPTCCMMGSNMKW